LVTRHGLAPLAARAGATSFRDELARATLAWHSTDRELPPLVAELTLAGVRVAAIKGVAYAARLYASPAERPMSDVDLLIPHEHLTTARRVLRGRGFTPATAAVLHHAEPWTRSDFVIDLHWNIIAPGRSRIDLDAIWSRTSAGWPDGGSLLEPSDALVFHLVHFARNRLRLPLINVVDTARLLENADASTAIARARVWGVGSAVEIALRFCRAILEARDGSRPGGWLGPTLDEVAGLAPQSTARKLFFDVAVAGSPRQLASRAVHFGANQLRGRVAALKKR
jgi:hypothetical protein